MAKFAQGKFVMKNPKKYVGNKIPTYRSGWELTFMKFCDEHPNVTNWASESVRIPYKNPFTGKNTIYVPDFFINYTDKNGKSHAELIEVKPSNQTFVESLGKSRHNKAHYALNQVKWAAANAWCKQQKIQFRIITEKDIYHQGYKKR